MNSIADIRRDYKLTSLDEAAAEKHAIRQFDRWWQEAVNSQIDEVNALTLATCDSSGKPTARVVLLKGYDDQGFVFFTNYESRKGRELLANPQACMVFFWKELERQVRIEGTISKVSDAESDAYFVSRPQSSQLGAWASPQSSIISSRSVIEHNLEQLAAQYQHDNPPRPPHWGGYRLRPSSIEFWQGRPSRLHDRLLYTTTGNDVWAMQRLAP